MAVKFKNRCHPPNTFKSSILFSPGAQLKKLLPKERASTRPLRSHLKIKEISMRS